MSLFNRAVLLDQTGDYRGAIRDYTRVISEYPKFIYVYQLRAVARRKIGDINGAIRDEDHIFRETIAHRYGYSTNTSRLKSKTRKKSQINIDEYSKLVVQDDEDEEIQYESELRGKIQNKEFEIKLLPIIIITIVENTPTDIQLTDYRIQAYNIQNATLNNFKKGVELCVSADDKRLDAADSKKNKTLNNNSKINNNNYMNIIYSQAEECFSNVISDIPNLAEAYYNRAITREMQGKLIDATDDLDKAIKINPVFAKAYFNRGINHYNQGNLNDAMKDLSKAGELGIHQAYSIMKQLKQ